MAQTGTERGAPARVPPSILVSAGYSSAEKVAELKFYDPESDSIVLWKDRTGHKPYCYSRLEPGELGEISGREDVIKIESVRRSDLITDSDVTVSKIVVDDPLAIGGKDDSIRNLIDTWEADIKYYENYLYDQDLIVGRYYEGEDGELRHVEKEISEEVKLALKSLLWDRVSSDSMIDSKEFQEYIAGWANLLNQPIPHIKRAAFDIEVEFESARFRMPRWPTRL